MSQIILIVMLIIAIIFIGVAGYYNVSTAAQLADLPEYKNETDENALAAHKYATWASVVCWVGIFLILLVIIGYIVLYVRTRGTPGVGSGLRYILYFALILTIVLMVVAYILSTYSIINIINITTSTREGEELVRNANVDNYIASSVTIFSIAFISMFFISLAIS